MARALHSWSGRPGPFVPVNCAALPARAGRGGAVRLPQGRVHRRRGGQHRAVPRGRTGAACSWTRSSICRAACSRSCCGCWRTGRCAALGETRQTPVDVRIIAATQEPLGQAVAERRFRAGSAGAARRADGGAAAAARATRGHHAAVPRVPAPALRRPAAGARAQAGRGAVPVRLAAERARAVAAGAAAAGRAGARTGAAQERTCRSGCSGVAPDSQPGRAAAARGKQARRSTDDDSEFEALIEALRRHGGSVAKAAAAMGINRARAYRLLSAHPDFSVDDLRAADTGPER